VFDALQSTDTKVLEHAKDSRHAAPLITQGTGMLWEDLC